MKTQIRFLLIVLAVGAPAWAAEPLRDGGNVLVLDNHRVLAGEVERVGEQYRVRRSVGEMWVPAKKALFVGDSMEQAHAYLQSKANLRDPDERLRLARWCQANGLPVQALAEVNAALELRPNHVESRRLLAVLQRIAAEPALPPAPEPVQAEAESTLGWTPGPDLAAKSVSSFTTKVQPILMNACASCHAGGKGGAFKLTRSLEGSGRRAVQQNLTAVLAQINPQQPQASSFLIKAASRHGDLAKAPLQDRQAKALQSLEEWVQNAVASNPHLREHASVPTSHLLLAESKTTAEAVPTKADAAPATPNKPTPPVEPTTEFSSPDAKPVPAGPVDEFDASIFNRQMHPEKKPQ